MSTDRQHLAWPPLDPAALGCIPAAAGAGSVPRAWGVPRRHQGRECGAELLGLVRRNAVRPGPGMDMVAGSCPLTPRAQLLHTCPAIRAQHSVRLTTLSMHPCTLPSTPSPPSGPSWSTLRPTSPPCCPPTTLPTSLSSSTPRGAASAASPPNGSTTRRLAASHRSRRQMRPSLQPWWVAFLRPAAPHPAVPAISVLALLPLLLALDAAPSRSPPTYPLIHSSSTTQPHSPTQPFLPAPSPRTSSPSAACWLSCSWTASRCSTTPACWPIDKGVPPPPPHWQAWTRFTPVCEAWWRTWCSGTLGSATACSSTCRR